MWAEVFPEASSGKRPMREERWKEREEERGLGQSHRAGPWHVLQRALGLAGPLKWARPEPHHTAATS